MSEAYENEPQIVREYIDKQGYRNLVWSQRETRALDSPLVYSIETFSPTSGGGWYLISTVDRLRDLPPECAETTTPLLPECACQYCYCGEYVTTPSGLCDYCTYQEHPKKYRQVVRQLQREYEAARLTDQ